MDEDEYKIVDNFVKSNFLVTLTKDAIADARYEHRQAVKKAALAKTAYKDLIKKRESKKDESQ